MSYELLLIPLRSGIRYGIYHNNSLYKQGLMEGKSLDSLIGLWMEIKDKYVIGRIFYARGPGSLSALKLLHIFVHTLAITSQIELFATDSFYFSQHPILAFGNQYFIKQHQEIVLKTFDAKIQDEIPDLPKSLNDKDFTSPLEPLYVLPAL